MDAHHDPLRNTHDAVKPTRFRRRSMGVFSAVLLLIPVGAICMAGSVQPLRQTLLHGLVLIGLVSALRLGASRLERAGMAIRLSLAWIPLIGVMGIGLIPLPKMLRGFLSPGTVSAYPSRDWSTLSMDPESTVGELCLWVMAGTYAMLVGIWGAQGRRQWTAEWVLLGGAFGLLILGYGHAILDLDSAFGWIRVEQPPTPYFGPLVNPNHLSTLLLLALPHCLERTRDSWHRRAHQRWLWGLVIMWILITPVVSASMGGVAAMALVVAGYAWWRLPSIKTFGVVGGGVGLGAVLSGGVLSFIHPQWLEKSASPRMSQWGDQWSLFADHWFSGVGAGGYGFAYLPYRSDPVFAYFRHGHSDGLEWVVETGLLGLLALWLFWRALPTFTTGTRRGLWTLGLLGVCFHSMIDFPLQIPAVLLCVVGALAIRLSVFEDAIPVSSGVVKRWLWGLICLQVLGMCWQGRAHIADGAASQIFSSEDSVFKDFDWAAPWRYEWQLANIIRLLREGDVETVRETAIRLETQYEANGTALRTVADIFWKIDEKKMAYRAIDRAILRDPNDYRSYALKSVFLEEDLQGGPAVETLAQAFRHWPRPAPGHNERPLERAYRLLPLGGHWLDVLRDAPAYWSAQLASLLLKQGEFEVGMQACDQASILNPEVYGEMVVRADLWLQLNDVAQAEKEARRVIKQNVTRPWGWAALGRVHMTQKDYESALEAFLEAFSRAPNRLDIALNAVNAAGLSGGPDRGLAVLDRVRARTGEKPQWSWKAAQYQFERGAFGECRKELTSANLKDHIEYAEQAMTLWTQCSPHLMLLP